MTGRRRRRAAWGLAALFAGLALPVAAAQTFKPPPVESMPMVKAPGLAQIRTPKDVDFGVRKTLYDQMEAWDRGDMAAFMMGYDESWRTRLVIDGRSVAGFRNIAAEFRQRYPAAAGMGQLTFSDMEIRASGPDTALATGLWSQSLPAGDRAGRFTKVLRRGGDRWLIVLDQTTTEK